MLRFERTAANSHSENSISADDVTWAVEITSRYLIKGNTCLPKAMVGKILLNFHRIPARFRLGFLKSGNGEIQAHAWIESEGKVLIGGTEEDVDIYTPLGDIADIKGVWV